MRSSKSRSRSKSNRPRTLGNIVNRVFDSSGPEGKVRGTPQQIIDKYQFLARDAQLSNDRVAAENFQQHAEHYTRMLGEAMREMAGEQDQRRDSGGQNGMQNNAYGNGSQGQNGNYRDRPRDDAAEAQPAFRSASVMDVADLGDENGLVETPEARPRPDPARAAADRPGQAERPERQNNRPERQDRPERQERRNDRPRFVAADPRDGRPSAVSDTPAPAPEPVAVAPLSPMMPSFATLPDEPAAVAKPAAVRRPRAPRKPKAEGGDGGPTDSGPAEAAE